MVGEYAVYKLLLSVLTFVSQGEPTHLREVFECLEADGPSGSEAGDANLVLFDEARPRLALLTRLLVHQTN